MATMEQKYQASAAAGCESCAKVLRTGKQNGVPAHPPWCPHSVRYHKDACAECLRLQSVIKERDEEIRKLCLFVIRGT